jgi:hypothetical protein
MPYPSGMATFQKHFGPAYAMNNGDLLRMVVTISASTSATWVATNTPLVAFFQDIEASAGLQGVLTLPSPDQAGFVDGDGNTVRNWTYTANINYIDDDGRIVNTAETTFTYIAGGPSPSDLEGSVPVPGTSGVKVAVTVPTRAALDGNDLVLFDLSGAEMFRGNVRGTYDGGVIY